jgi:hypothetical protein
MFLLLWCQEEATRKALLSGRYFHLFKYLVRTSCVPGHGSNAAPARWALSCSHPSVLVGEKAPYTALPWRCVSDLSHPGPYYASMETVTIVHTKHSAHLTITVKFMKVPNPPHWAAPSHIRQHSKELSILPQRTTLIQSLAVKATVHGRALPFHCFSSTWVPWLWVYPCPISWKCGWKLLTSFSGIEDVSPFPEEYSS